MRKATFSAPALIGMSDGWMLSFVLAAGLTGAGLSATFIWQAGLVAILIAATAMWLGTYFSAREAPEDPEDEKMWQRYNYIGLSRETQQLIREEMVADEQRWQQQLQEQYQLPDAQKLMKGTGWQIALACLLSGLSSLLPFFILKETLHALYWSAGITGGALIVLAILRSRLLSTRVLSSLLRYLPLAAVTALLAYFIGAQLV